MRAWENGGEEKGKEGRAKKGKKRQAGAGANKNGVGGPFLLLSKGAQECECGREGKKSQSIPYSSTAFQHLSERGKGRSSNNNKNTSDGH